MSVPRSFSPPPAEGADRPGPPDIPPVDRCVTEGHCITCSDEGIPMRVTSLNVATGLATCADESGACSDVMTALVEEVRPGDLLLVHAGTALLRLDPETEASG